MNKFVIKNANVIFENTIKKNYSVEFSNGTIINVAKEIKDDNATAFDAKGAYLSAGFIDLHVHGGNGSDFMDATIDDFERITSFHASCGTTSMLATTLTSPDNELFEMIDCYNSFVSKKGKDTNLAGIHLEGPYFSFNQRGAQDKRFLKSPSPSHYNAILNKSEHIKRISVAPELEGSKELAQHCLKQGIIISMGHTDCTAKEAIEAYESGYNLITHFYSGMNSVIRKNCYRVAGLVEAGYLIDDLNVEIIADGSHLPAELLQLIFKIKGKERTCLITDCSSAGGIKKEYGLLGSRKNGQTVIIKDGVAFLQDMSGFAGSVASTDILLQTMLNLTNISLCDIIFMMTVTPARILGLDNYKGKIEKGFDADMVLFEYKDRKINIKNVFLNGKCIK